MTTFSNDAGRGILKDGLQAGPEKRAGKMAWYSFPGDDPIFRWSDTRFS
jgi:hypothetical protein